MPVKLLVINGPNLNLLGRREPEIYGAQTYENLTLLLKRQAAAKGLELTVSQSNHEGEIIDIIQQAAGRYQGLIINPGAYTHYSYAIFDAIKGVALPAVEVHLSNIAAREEFRRHSVTAAACLGQISGLGFYGYVAALDYLAAYLGAAGDGDGGAGRNDACAGNCAGAAVGVGSGTGTDATGAAAGDGGRG
jgi:3-dehydroquinate dehydratase-2